MGYEAIIPIAFCARLEKYYLRLISTKSFKKLDTYLPIIIHA